MSDFKVDVEAMSSFVQSLSSFEEAAKEYDKLYAEYNRLHDYFGRGGSDVMKRLKAIRTKIKG